MYSGTTFRKKSGHFIGVHQKIDRIARRNLSNMPGASEKFPSIHEILHFEGDNGPDGIKRKSPSVDEPWHYIDPTKPEDTTLIVMIMEHYKNLVTALKTGNRERSAFEAAWIAHAISDGLTPAHHYPLSDKIEELWGMPKEQRLSVVDKNLIRGENRRDTVSRNWEYWGAKGVFTTHLLFELGIATAIKTTRFQSATVDGKWLVDAKKIGVEKQFISSVQYIYEQDMYKNFWQNGWTTRLAQEARKILLPEIIRMVTFTWYSALQEAEN